MMASKKRRHRYLGPLAKEIERFIEFKRKSGSVYTSSECALIAFDRFCTSEENQGLTIQELADAWVMPDKGKPKHDGGCCVRQLGQYLTEQGHPKAFMAFSASGAPPRMLGVNPGVFVKEIKEFVAHKRIAGRKYTVAEHCLNAFDKFCSMDGNQHLTYQQMADAWTERAKRNNGADVSMVRELGLYLTLQGSEKSFVIPHANGDMPKPAFTGYASSLAKEIESFLRAKRAEGMNYRQEEFRLKDFDRFCIERPDLTPQQLADTFIQSRKDYGYFLGRRSASVIKEFGKHLVENGYANAFTIIDENYIVGPYAEDISAFVDFKKSCGFKYHSAEYFLKVFDAFCAAKGNESLTPQRLVDEWVLKRDGEHPNTRSGRVGPVRVFGKYLSSIGHPGAFTIPDDVAQGKAAEPPYLFSGFDIDIFFSACADLQPEEKDPYAHIVLPAAYLFMHCMGVRTCELEILMENVDFDTGEVVIADAKTGDRVVHMSKELSGSISKYSLTIEGIFPHRKYLFPASASRLRKDFAKRFREIWESSVPAEGRGVPRLYDFRHHFLYRNVELCMRNGSDVNVLQPYIMRHMGHKLPESFQYYFHLSPPIRKEVSKIKNNLDWMMPDVPEVPYE